MDALTEALSSSFCVTREANSTSAPHPRLSQYKSKYSALDQDERRRKFLKEQKETMTISDEEVEEKQKSQQQDEMEDEGMEVEQRKKSPKDSANQKQQPKKRQENMHFHHFRFIYRRGGNYQFYWLQSKVEAVEGLSNICKQNPFRFVSLSSISCTTDSILKALAHDYSFSVPQCPLMAKPDYAAHPMQQILELKKPSSQVRPADKSRRYELEHLSITETQTGSSSQEDPM